jgi:hypothetical protein
VVLVLGGLATLPNSLAARRDSGEGYRTEFDFFVVEQVIDDERRGEYLHHLLAVDSGRGPNDLDAVGLSQRTCDVRLVFYFEGAPENESIIHT